MIVWRLCDDCMMVFCFLFFKVRAHVYQRHAFAIICSVFVEFAVESPIAHPLSSIRTPQHSCTTVSDETGGDDTNCQTARE